MKIKRGGLRAALPVVLLVCGCTDAVPTSNDDTRMPIDVNTIEVRLPFDEFATEFQTFSGFGSATEVFPPVVAREWGEDLNAYTLLRFGGLPDGISVIPPDGSAPEPDTSYVVFGGEVRLRLARDEEVGNGPFELEAAAIQSEWHRASATWEMAVDTLGNQVPWGEPGGGPVDVVGTVMWEPVEVPPDQEEDEEDEGPGPNTVVIEVDSITANRWVDTGRLDRGLRVGSLTPGSLIEIASVEFEAFARSEINADTVVRVSPTTPPAGTVIYTPDTDPPAGSFHIGGAPARRATFRIDLPEVVQLDSEACEAIQCPVELRPERFIYAGLELHTTATDPAGLRPDEARVVELRPILAPEYLPRSPLGAPIACPRRECAMTMAPTVIPHEAFSSAADARVDLPMTRHVRDLLREPQPGQPEVPATVGIMSARSLAGSEIHGLSRLSFHGPGTELEPTLRIILTLSDELGLP